MLRNFFDNLMDGTIKQMELFNNNYASAHETPGGKTGNKAASSAGNSSVDRNVTADAPESLPRTRRKKVLTSTTLNYSSAVASSLRDDDSSPSGSDSDVVKYLKTKPSSKKTSASSIDDSDDVDESDGGDKE